MRLADDGCPHAGDPFETRLDPAEVGALVLKWDGLAWRKAHYWWGRAGKKGDVEDFHQAAVLGLLDGARRFDPSRGFQFCTFAGHYADKWCQDLCGHEATGGVHVPLDKTRTGYFVGVTPFSQAGDEGGVPFDQTLPERPTPDAGPEFPADFWPRVFAGMDARTARVVRWRFVDGWTLDRIGTAAGLSKERVRQVLKRACERIGEDKPELAEYLSA